MNGTIDYTSVDKESLMKLSAGARGNVQIKPPKKMKKRRQLDALVSNGKKPPRRKQSGHELLRSNDSESSELEEFSVLDNKWNKRWSDSSCWSTCYTLTSVLVMATCILASGALIWMHLELKQNFKELKEKMDLVESKKAVTPDEFQTLQTQVQAANRSVTGILSGKNGLETLSQSIENIQNQITALKTVQPNTPSAEPVATEVKSLAGIVASVGSGLQTVQSDVASLKIDRTNLQTQLQDIINRVSHLEKPNGREGGSSVSIPDNIMEQIMSINSTLMLHIEQFNIDKAKLEAQRDALEQLSRAHQNQITSLNMQVTNVTETQEQLQNLITLQQQAAVEKPSVTTAEGNKTDVITELKEKFNELKKVVQQLNNGSMIQLPPQLESRSESTGDINLVLLSKDRQDLMTFKADVFQDINNLNSSLASLNHTVDILQKDVDSLFVNTNGAVRNVTQLVDMVASVLKSSKEFQKMESVTLAASPKVPSSTTSLPDKKNKEEEQSQPSPTGETIV